MGNETSSRKPRLGMGKLRATKSGAAEPGTDTSLSNSGSSGKSRRKDKEKGKDKERDKFKSKGDRDGGGGRGEKGNEPAKKTASAVTSNSSLSGERKSSLGSQVADFSAKNKVGLEDFVLMKTVGKGSFGKVIQVRKKDTGQIYAMKVLKKEQVIRRKQFEHTMAERRILEEIDHPFIVSLRFAFQTTQKLYMVFDYFNGGELFHYLSKGGRFGEERSRFYAAEIVLGLECVHGLNIIYRDLKPENLLLDADGHVKITDFGLSKENVVKDDVKSFCGTPEYLAPEVLKRQSYGKAVDWWSLGTLLYEMISGLPPYYDRNRERMYKKILGAELRFPSNMSVESRSICGSLLIRDPKNRLGYRGAHEIKAHPFFASIDMEKLLRKEIEPPFKPQVQGEEDTRNVDKSFTAIPAAVTPTPADSHLPAAVADKEFENFTFAAVSVIDGERYSVSFDNEEEFEQVNTEGGKKSLGAIPESKGGRVEH